MSLGAPELIILLGMLVVPVVLIVVVVKAVSGGRQQPSVPAAVAPGWYADPLVPGRRRYFDGTAWTDHLSD